MAQNVDSSVHHVTRRIEVGDYNAATLLGTNMAGALGCLRHQ
jgi:hypothetical protein